VLFNLLLLDSPAANPQAASPLVGFLPILLILGIFYVLLFLPMQRQRKAQQRMLRELQTGSTVVTSGGIIGTITEMKKEDDTIVLRVKPDGVKLQIARTSVTSLLPTGEAKK
jgi:preprotein translocase subunit YajC